MLVGQLLPCSFRKGNSKIMFISAIIDMKQTETENGLEKAYVLSWPEGLQQMQRRLFFRAAIPENMNLQVKVWNSVPVVDKAPDTPPIAIGKLTNISVGGAQVEIDEQYQLSLNKSYLLEIELPAPEKPLLVVSQTRRIEAIPGTSSYQYGMQFLSLDNTPAGQESMIRLARFANYIRSTYYNKAKGQRLAGDRSAENSIAGR